MSNISVHFQNPMVLWFIIPVIAIILAPYLLLQANRRKSAKRIIPVILHCIMAILLLLILAGVSIVKTTDEDSVMVLVDMSDSTLNVQDIINEHATDIINVIDDKTEVGVIAFADDCVYKLDVDDKLKVDKLLCDATNIGVALEYAVSLMPTDKSRRIILLSDGKETDGDSVSVAKHLATQGVRIDAMYFDTTTLDTKEVQISEFSIVEGSYVGDEVKFLVELKSNMEAEVALVLYDNEKMVQRLEHTIDGGSNLIEMSAAAETAGGHTYRIKVESDEDTVEKNNQAYTYLNVAGAPNILVIADTIANAETMQNILSEENQVDVVVAYRAPDSIVELCNYDEVILVNVDNNELPDDYDKLLEAYVSVYGRSLLTIGGSSTYMSGNMKDTAFEEMLPVTLGTDDGEGDNIALALVLDCSNSMSMTEMYLSVAKQGAIQCVQALTDKDYVAVVSFNTWAKVQSPLIKANKDNKDYLTRLISGLTTAQGTYYVKALQLAYNELIDFEADIKHVIFLSDGNPSDEGYNKVVETMVKNNITVSTIGLGYESDILSNMANKGNGRYYYVADALQLPDIMLRETEQVTTGLIMSGTYRPVMSPDSPLIEEADKVKLPVISNYACTELKDGATAYITANEGHPIYAEWTYGAGKVASYTGSVISGWSDEWLNNKTGLAVLKAMVSTTISKKHNDSSLDVDMTLRGKTVDIVVDTIDNKGEVTVNILSNADEKMYDLTKTGSNTYKGSVDIRDTGVHEMIIAWTDEKGQVMDYKHTAVSLSYSSEYDMYVASGRECIENICRYAGGTISEDTNVIATIDMDAKSFVYNPWKILGIIVAILLIIDIAVRKIRWKDIKDYFLRIRHR